VAAHTNLLTIAADFAQNLGRGTTFTWFGQTVGTGDLLVMPTLIGDLNMDGSVNSLDYFALTPNLGKTGRPGAPAISLATVRSTAGLFALTPNLGQSLAGLSPALASPNDGVTAPGLAPEPATLVLLGLGGVMLLGRRRVRGHRVRSQP